jgi:hypothetical protein
VFAEENPICASSLATTSFFGVGGCSASILTVRAIPSRLDSVCYSTERKNTRQLVGQPSMNGASPPRGAVSRGDQPVVAEPVWQAQRHHDCIRAAREFAGRTLRTPTLRDVGPVDLDLPVKLRDARIIGFLRWLGAGLGILACIPFVFRHPGRPPWNGDASAQEV